MKHDVSHGFELVALGEASVVKAQERITACEACSKAASRRFENVLIEVLGTKNNLEYMLAAPAECPRCGSAVFEATLVSTEDLSDLPEPSVTETDVVFVDKNVLAEAESFIAACENCEPTRSEIRFDQLLDSLTGCDPTLTEYVICHAARCPHCHHDVMEKTRILPL